MAGIKESMEVLDALDTWGDDVIKACADKKLNLLDLRYALEALKATGTALKGIQMVPGELKGMDGAEADALLAKVGNVLPKLLDAALAIGSLL